jgi:hypothetical protein
MILDIIPTFCGNNQIPFEKKEFRGESYHVIEINETLKIEISAIEGGGAFFRTNLALILFSDKEKVYRQLLESNFLYQSTLGCVLGIDPEEKYITLGMYVYTKVNLSSLWDNLEHFCNAVEYWKHNLEKKHDFV